MAYHGGASGETMILYFGIPIFLAAVGGAVVAVVWYRAVAEDRKGRKIEMETQAVETPFGRFTLRWFPPDSVAWEAIVDIGPASLVTLEVADRDGAPDRTQLDRLPSLLANLPSLVAIASAKSAYPEHVVLENLLSVELVASPDREEDLTLQFSSGEDDMGVFVSFRGEQLLGEVAID